MPLSGPRIGDPCSALWCEVVLTAVADAKRDPRGREELTRPSEAIGTILSVLDINLGWWRAVVVPELQRHWAVADARRAAREEEAGLTVELGGAVERAKRGWRSRRARLAARAHGRFVAEDRPAPLDPRSTGSGAALAAKSTSRGSAAPAL